MTPSTVTFIFLCVNQVRPYKLFLGGVMGNFWPLYMYRPASMCWPSMCERVRVDTCVFVFVSRCMYVRESVSVHI